MIVIRILKACLILLLVKNIQSSSSVCVDDKSGECANVAADSTNPEPADSNCPSRPHIIRCAGKYLDTNQNNKLERSELEDAIGNLSFLMRTVLKIIGPVDSIMKKCDYDGDGAISIDHDMANTAETCLATCFKRRAFKNAFFPACDLAR
jgi:hypothetical protein